MNEPEAHISKVVSELLSSIPPSEEEKIEKRMLLAAKIDDAIKAKGWKRKDLLAALNKKNPSIVTKWLSGTHNFTMDTLIDLERVLDINLINLKREDQPVILKFHFEVRESVRATPPTNYLPETSNYHSSLVSDQLHFVNPIVQTGKA